MGSSFKGLARREIFIDAREVSRDFETITSCTNSM
ncbi:hypothetical protein [Lysinibacillus fusiformis]